MPKKKTSAPARKANLISRAEMARRGGVTPGAITQACAAGRPLEPACVGKQINVTHEAAQSWLARRAEHAPIDVDSVDAVDPDEEETPPAKRARTVRSPSAPPSSAPVGTVATETTDAPWASVDLETLEEPLRTELTPLWWTPRKGLLSPEIHQCRRENHAPNHSRETPYAV
jgi:hypothetical protein